MVPGCTWLLSGGKGSAALTVAKRDGHGLRSSRIGKRRKAKDAKSYGRIVADCYSAADPHQRADPKQEPAFVI